jgi:hypothetical protein
MAAKKKKANKVTIAASGSVKGSGVIVGKGSITLRLADATKVKLSVESKADSTKVVLSNATNIRIRKSQDLKVTGSIAKEFNTRGLEGTVGLRFIMPKSVDVSVEHQFNREDDVTSLKLTFSF